MPEPIKTRGKLERRAGVNYMLYEVDNAGALRLGRSANPIIDTACEVVTFCRENFLRVDSELRDLIEAHAEALTTAGCVREVEEAPERFVAPDDEFQSESMFGLHDTETGYIMRFNSRLARDAQRIALNRLSQQTGRGE